MIQASNSKDEPDRLLGVRTPGLIVTHVDNNSEEEAEEMSLHKKKGLREEEEG